jgi:hypothetical protein
MGTSDLGSTCPLVESWIDVATRGLAETARQRVREEILDHVLEAVDDATAAGLETERAVERAVAGLGDPERAGRALRRTNLRPWEAKLVGGLARPQPRWVLALYLAGLPAFVVVNAGLPEGAAGALVFGVALASMVLGIGARFWLARRLARRGSLRAALVADVFGPWLYYAGMVVGSNLIVGRNEIAAPVVYLTILVGCIGLVAWLWPKLGRGPSGPTVT